MDEDLGAAGVIDRAHAVVEGDGPAPVALAVDEDDQGVVGDLAGDLVHPVVLFDEQIAVEVEGVEGGVERGLAVRPLARLVDALLGGGPEDGPDVEAVLQGLVGLDAEKELRHPTDVGLELAQLPGDVALRHEDEVDFVVGIALDLNFEDRIPRRGRLPDDVIVRRVDDPVKDRMEEVALVALLDDEKNGPLGQGDADGPLEDADVARQGRGRRLVLGVHRVEAAQEDEAIRCGVVNLQDVPALVEKWDEARPGFRPDAFLVDLVDGHPLLPGVAGLEEVDPQGFVEEIVVERRLGLRGGGRCRKRERQEQQGEGGFSHAVLLRSSRPL